MSVCVPVCQSVSLASVSLFASDLTVFASFPEMCLSVCLSVFIYVCLSVSLFASDLTVFASFPEMCLSVCLCSYMSVCQCHYLLLI